MIMADEKNLISEEWLMFESRIQHIIALYYATLPKNGIPDKVLTKCHLQ